MRKFFSLIAAVLFAGSMMATEVTFTKDDFAGQGTANTGSEVSATKGGVTFTFSKGYCADESLRCYAHGALSITAETTIEKINFTTTGGKTGGLDAEVTVGATSYSVDDLASQARFTQIVVTLEGGEPVEPTTEYYVAGNMNEWGVNASYKLAANPANDGEYMGKFSFEAGAAFKVVSSTDGSAIIDWFPAGMDNNYQITEAGEYTVYFRPEGGVEGWHEGYINAVKKVIPQYEVSEAIAAGLAENDEILVRGVITKMEFKGTNFAKYGSVNIYVADATGAEGAFEFYNCYSLNADTFRTSDPAYDPESTAWVEYDEVADENGNAIHVGDTVIAFGKYKLYNETHELNTGCYLTEIKHPEDAPVVPVDEEVIYEWSNVEEEQIGATILGAAGVEVSTVKIHTNTDAVPAIKFGSSYVYADGKWIAIKPAEGGFKAGDVLSLAAVFNNADDTKYAQVDLRAANGDTRIWLSDSASTINGRTSAAEPIVQTYTLEADQDSLFLGRYGNTGMFVTMLKVVREGGDVPPVEEHTYTVAGSSDVLFGTTWAPANTANDMALVEGLYTWEKSEQTLAAGNILFKVCEDHAWDVAYPAQNYELNIPESGIYTVTITFNAETKEVAADATKTGEAVVIPSVAMHGNFLGSWADTENFAIAQDNASASLTLTLAEGNYEFGMRIGGSGNWTANGANLTREANTTNLAEGQGNMHIAADVAGDYVFTYTYETQVLEVVYPEAPVVPDTIVIDIEQAVQYSDHVAQAGWWQFIAENEDYEISLSNNYTTQAAGVYTIADLDEDYTYVYIKADSAEVHFVDGEFTLTEGEDGSRTIEGVMTGDDGNIYNIKLVFRIPTAETTVNVEIPEWGVADATAYYGWAGYIFYGETEDENIYVQIVIPGTDPVGQFTYGDVYAGGTGIEVAGNYQGIYSMNINISVDEAQNAIITADILCYNNTLYHVTTIVGQGVDNIDAAVKAIKRIVNGQVVIEKAGKTYNMNGAVIR